MKARLAVVGAVGIFLVLHLGSGAALAAAPAQLWAKVTLPDIYTADLGVDGSGNVYVTGEDARESAAGGGDFITTKYDASANEVWSAWYTATADSLDRAVALALDPSGNVCVTGLSEEAGARNMVTIKYAPDGSQLWAAQYEGWVEGLAIDSAGNVYVAGTTHDEMDNANYATVKYDPAGNQLWAARFLLPGSSQSVCTSLGLDASGNAYVTGMSHLGSGSYYAYTTVKYDPDGNELWVATYSSGVDNEDKPVAMAVDASGYAHVTGMAGPHGYGHATTIKYDPDGHELWVVVDSDPSVSFFALALDPSGSAYLGGSRYDTATSFDFHTVKYDSDGNELWAANYDTAQDSENVNALALDGSGNIYVTGVSGTSTGGQIATVKYDPDGNELWMIGYDTPFFSCYRDTPHSIQVDGSDNVYVAGEAFPTSFLCGGQFSITIKYSQQQGCFIATAAFGHAMQGKIDSLRSFRDACLIHNSVGSAVVEAYYSYSPPIARYISERGWARAIIRTLLLPVIGFVSLLV